MNYGDLLQKDVLLAQATTARAFYRYKNVENKGGA
jgi:hypothetical protein